MSDIISIRGEGTFGDKLREYAAMADRGEILAFGIAVVHPGANVATEHWNPTAHGHELLSAVTILQHRVLERMTCSVCHEK